MFGASTHADEWTSRHWSSRALHRVGEIVAHAGSGIVAAALIVGWLTLGLTTGFPDWWETALYVTTGSVTFVMVFVIQHTQQRQTAATQRKLDELLRSSELADSTLIAVEEGPTMTWTLSRLPNTSTNANRSRQTTTDSCHAAAARRGTSRAPNGQTR